MFTENIYNITSTKAGALHMPLVTTLQELSDGENAEEIYKDVVSNGKC